MDRNRVEKLKELVTQQEAEELAILDNAYTETLRAYRNDQAKPAEKVQAFQAAKTALQELMFQLEAKYLSGTEPLRSVMDALRYLQRLGWKVEKSKLYKDRDAGLLPVNPDRTVDEVALLAYAAKYLEKVRASGDSDKHGQMAEEKLEEEIARLRIQKEKLRFELDRDKKKYIHRSRWLAELVAKLKATKNAALSVVHTRAPELISAVGGDLKKQPMFIELISEYLEDAFDQLSNVREIKVLITEDEKRKMK
jgi:hypothetical protein